MRTLPLALHAARELGLGSITAFALYEFQRKVGWLRLRMPIEDWDSVRLETLLQEGVPTDPAAYSLYRLGTDRSFFFKPQADLSLSLKRSMHGLDEILLKEADEILEGRFRLFGGPPIEYGYTPDWHKFPPFDSGPGALEMSMDVHWTALEPDDLPFDIKLLWEPSRFGWAHVLGRAYRLSGKDKFAEGFWHLFESWRGQNPPNQGPHWISAQEVAIRLMVLTFSLYVFHPYLAEDPGRNVLLTETIAAHAERIPPTLLYSRAQGNNHLIVEAVGLYTAGLLFPEMKQAGRWRVEGRRWLIEALSRQIFPDGGYVQHSSNYQRLALQAALWATRLGQLNRDGFPDHILLALRNTTSCLEAMVDAETGRAPNYGSNDGALLLPLTNCSFRDYRPVIRLAHRCLSMEETLSTGPWDEACLWFGLWPDVSVARKPETSRMFEHQSFSEIEQRKEPEEKTTISDTSVESRKEPRFFPQAGLYFLRGVETWGMFRCATFTQRPGQSDQLHLDLWWRGENIARDAGTYLYNGESPWQNGLGTAKAHNTTIADEKEPMSRAGRFLWLDWAQGTILGYERSKDGILGFISGEHDGYKEMGLRITRSIVRAGDELWMVVDDLIGSGHHTLRSGWLLPEDPWETKGATILLRGARGSYRVKFDPPSTQWSLYRAGQLLEGEDLTDGAEILGWFSPTYAYMEPGLYFVASIKGALPLRIVTLWCLGDAEPDQLKVNWKGGPFPGQTVISQITYDQKVLDL